MHCPRDRKPLEPFTLHGLAVERCPFCAGMWLDYEELDQLEDTVFPEDDFKGSLIFREHSTREPCPRCEEPMREFKYRLHDLVLEHCPNLHGFWLDAGEDERVLETLMQRASRLEKKAEAEREWAAALRKLRSPALANRLRPLLTRRSQDAGQEG